MSRKPSRARLNRLADEFDQLAARIQQSHSRRLITACLMKTAASFETTGSNPLHGGPRRGTLFLNLSTRGPWIVPAEGAAHVPAGMPISW